MRQFLTLAALAFLATFVSAAEYKSHPPLRPLPVPSQRAKADGPAFHVDATKGHDANDGSAAKPWKTLAHAVPKLKAGDTLYLRAGTYYERVAVKIAGTGEKPITIRSFPGELAAIDGGLREFAETHATAWEPVKGGAIDEYRSVKPYPKHEGVVFGHFLDSMVTLHGYRFVNDLRSDNSYWTIKSKIEDDPTGIYCGPGLWLDPKTNHLHCRLAHTRFAHLAPGDNYKGETDPRKLSLVVSAPGVPLALNGAKHLRVQDIVIRGGNHATLNVEKCANIELDGLTVYGGSPAVLLAETYDLKMVNCYVRGISAAWSWRGGQKYRGNAAYVLTARETGGGCKNVEIAHCEITDCHDGPFLGTITGLRFHHNLVDNFNDDGVYLMAMSVGGDQHYYQNRISRCLHCFSFAGKYQLGGGVYIFRNLIDQRGPVWYQWPESPDDPRLKPVVAGKPAEIPHSGWLMGDHGSPTWEKIYFYQNTVLFRDKTFRDNYGFGVARATAGTTRRAFNNVIVCTNGVPGLVLPVPEDDFAADHNLFWSTTDGPTFKGDFFATMKKSKPYEASKKKYAPGWGANDTFADPKFVKLAEWNDTAGDYRLSEGSPAIAGGVALDPKWPDVRKVGAGKPDLGALSFGEASFKVGPKK